LSISDYNFKGLEEYQCKVWLRLLFDSMKDIDNRTIRKEIIAHPHECNHPTCMKVAEVMRGIMK